MKAFEVDFRPFETQFDKAKAQKKEKQALIVQEAEEWEVKKKALHLEFDRRKAEAVAEALDKLTDAEIAALKNDFLAEIEKSPLLKKVLEAKGLDSAPIQAQWINFLARSLLEKMAYDFNEFLKIEGYATKVEQI